MKILVRLCLFLSGIAGATAEPEKDAITALEKAVWDSAQHKDLDRFQQLVAPQVRGVLANGIMVMGDYLVALPKRTMTSVDLRDFDIAFPDPATATIVYIAKVGSMKGDKEEFGTVNAGTVWRKTNGHWQAVFHAEAKQEPPK